MKIVLLMFFVFSSSAFAGSADLRSSLALLETTCSKHIRLNGSQQPDIEHATCIDSHGEYCFQFGVYAHFVDGSVGSVGWYGDSANGRPKARCNLNR